MSGPSWIVQRVKCRISQVHCALLRRSLRRCGSVSRGGTYNYSLFFSLYFTVQLRGPYSGPPGHDSEAAGTRDWLQNYGTGARLHEGQEEGESTQRFVSRTLEMEGSCRQFLIKYLPSYVSFLQGDFIWVCAVYLRPIRFVEVAKCGWVPLYTLMPYIVFV
jgi:hypothetical protein